VDLRYSVVQGWPSLGIIAFERGDQDRSGLVKAGMAKRFQIDNSYLQAAALVKPSKRIASQKSISARTGCSADK
jgi:hypothetical protein